ncbi:hypothetical protein [Candidatus Nitrosocosmicus sp. SS]|uniref:hypothetical protein n=2 Tax=Candidatus Nitrosocosmicus agrestis TaxID=2563600 RepID=UPI00122DDB3D|nr:hypothetical protein [Candidatus Nitrosocosmicus sp. SS]KAF0869821.1 hypothetical protein E5N71_03465 [Candidatus Nitrosocosmicus sp. SS]MDR4490423.1 hypothetical protein [Candidatus Nitrosocosmicus sp.]
MNTISIFIPVMTIFLSTAVLSGILPTASSMDDAQNNSKIAPAPIDQLTSNLTQAKSQLPIKPQLKVDILVPILYNNGTNVEPEKYGLMFEELVKQFGAISVEDNNVINGYWINPTDNKNYSDKNKMYWIIVPDTEENRHYFVNFQDKLESLFDQESILIYFTPVLNLLS